MARWANARKILNEMAVLDGGRVRRDDLSSLLPGNTNPRQKWFNAMKRGGEGVRPVPTSLVGGAAVVHGSNVLDAISRLLGRKYSSFLQECENETRALLTRCAVPAETIDAAILASRPMTSTVQEDAAPYRYENDSLYLNGIAVPMFFFEDSPGEPWLKAKPIHDFLGSKNIGHTMARVHTDDKVKLQDLVAKKGKSTVINGLTLNVSPNNARNSQDSSNSSTVPTEHNELSAWYVNESGLYCIIMGSEKAIAKPFQRWVTSVVLPSIRRTGRYDGTATADDESVPKRPRVEAE
jgi:prophage antirepressor-like protein